MKEYLFIKMNEHSKKLILGAVLLGFVLAGAGLLITQRHDAEPKAPPSQSVALLPIAQPKEGERLRDIPATDNQKRTDFLKEGAAAYGVAPAQTNQKAVAMACVYDATAKISNQARASESYRKDTEKIQADIKAVNQNCYAKYSDTDYVPPTPGPAHVHPDTLEQHH